MISAPENEESLWWLLVSPLCWVGHFLGSYVTVAVWCVKVAGRDGVLGSARVAIAVYTVVALAGVAAMANRGWRRARSGVGSTDHLDSAADRRRFLGYATLLLSGLSALAIVYVALAAVLLGDCR